MSDVDTSNYLYLAMTLHSWATEKDSEAEAVKSLRGYAGYSTMRDYGYVTYRIHPDSEISNIDGGIMHPKGHPPIKLTDRIKKRKAK
jgi:hypothetical protein